MSDRTHLPEQDEALRRVRADDTIRNGLRQIADQLAAIKPGHLMTAGQRHASALRIADQKHPHDEDAATELERQLLRRMPFVDGRQVTRDEYATQLRLVAEGVTL